MPTGTFCRDLVPVPQGTSMYGSSSAAVFLCVGRSHLPPFCNALVGARKYTDFGVLADVSFLLGEGMKAAKAGLKRFGRCTVPIAIITSTGVACWSLTCNHLAI
ncbi:hypothetical protein L211DRAFT_594349 [Terfezia boudieri ATCC MYA-4762]|uniref:Uncharacterized protein n=1 Tax=Terfezia boudieri ATCC MYA-4762 TaxID=1051890 RepID=A0A3N4LA03_9PEZI|nr:hypothetical protein L211DRAFT_594349 [Terfezia boudieri ATCC MYA-4762]